MSGAHKSLRPFHNRLGYRSAGYNLPRLYVVIDEANHKRRETHDNEAEDGYEEGTRILNIRNEVTARLDKPKKIQNQNDGPAGCHDKQSGAE